ncbi:MAG: hypothetical protein ACLVLH_23875 [Eisenbergiella massiliensis]
MKMLRGWKRKENCIRYISVIRPIICSALLWKENLSVVIGDAVKNIAYTFILAIAVMLGLGVL